MNNKTGTAFLRLLLFIICIFLFSFLKAQQTPVTIKISDQKNEPVIAASVTVINRLDSLQVFNKISDSSGSVVFNLIKNNQYVVTISSINFQPLEKRITVSNGQNNFTFIAESSSKTLGTVVVTSQKPLMRQEDDKTIIEPELLAATSTSGYEVLEKTPGLFVDQDGNVYINSLSPAAIYINGREMKMSVSDVATMLKSLPPNSIDKIEILRTPSAKYDASGTGGIVNVVLKKGVKIGLTGSVNAGWQQGKYGNEYIGVNINNNDGIKTSYVNVNFSRRNTYEQIKTDRLFDVDSMLSQDAYTIYPTNTYYTGFGISYELNKKWTISYDGRASLNDFNNVTDNRSIIYNIVDSGIKTNNLTNVNNDGYSLMLNSGLSSRYKIDTLGSEWTNDLAYTYARNDADQFFSTQFDFPVFPTTSGGGNNLNNRHYFTAQSDLRLKLPRRFTVETGIKTSLLWYNSVADYYREFGGIREKDNSRTNTFRYNENINSAYVQGSKTISDVIIKVGVRMENTNMDGRQYFPGDTSFAIHRTDFFPYIYLSKKVMTIAGYDLRAYLVYRRTINRPVYEQLNPFARFIDQYLSEMGNPALQPQFTQNYEANISVDERPLLAVGINDTKDIFTNVTYQSDSSKSHAFRTYDNLGKNREWYFRGLGVIPPGKKYFAVLGAQYNYNMYDGQYENKPLTFKKGTWMFFTYHSLKFAKTSQATLYGFIRLRGQQQFYELSTFGAVNASVNRQFLKNKMIITLSVNDIFNTNRNEFTINQGSVNASGFRRGDTRRFGINLRYNFGIRKKEENQSNFDINTPSQ